MSLKKKVEQIKSMIGHALENIIPCQLQSYMALMYGMVSLNDLIDNKAPTSDDKLLKFEQKLLFSGGLLITNWLPRVRAPISCVQFWINQLQLYNNQSLNSYKHLGYSSIEEIQADMIGYYQFYTQERFVIILLFYWYFIIIL